MVDAFTHKKLTEITDMAPQFGFADVHEARFAAEEMGAERTGFSYFRLKPGRRTPFGHRHDEAEEVYVILRGSGRMRLDEEVRELGELDAIRVAPGVVRAFEAGPEGLDYIVFGAKHDGDGELLHGWWTD